MYKKALNTSYPYVPEHQEQKKMGNRIWLKLDSFAATGQTSPIPEV